MGFERSGIAVDGFGSDDWNFPTTFTVTVPAHNSRNNWGWGRGRGGAQAELLLSEYLKASHHSQLEFGQQQASSYYDTVNVNSRKSLFVSYGEGTPSTVEGCWAGLCSFCTEVIVPLEEQDPSVD